MRDQGIIYGGLVLFLGVLTFPVWYNAAVKANAKPPEIKLPTVEKQCVAPVTYMRTSHMTLLMNWRQEVVRQNVRDYTAFNGKHYNMSLTGTCLTGCHQNKAEFCDRCHSYVGVSGPYCMDCHIDPRQIARSRP
jgi:hypothetical protein